MSSVMPDFESDFAKTYETFIRIALPVYEQMFPMADSFLKLNEKKDQNLLVVGAGGGAELVYFSQSHAGWRLTGVDPSEQMLKIAEGKVRQAGTSERVELFQGLTHGLPFEPKFDAATCILVLHFLPDDGAKLDLLRSIAERLQPGAPFILVSIYGDKGSAEFQRLFAACKEHFRSIGVNPEESEHVQRIPKLPLVTEDRIIELLREAGFDQVTRFFSAYQFGGWAAVRV